MAGNAEKIRLGAAWVTFGATDLGYTKGGITLTMETTIREITVDQEGTSPVAATILGRRATVDVPLAETDYERLQQLVPESTYASNLLEIESGMGSDIMDFAAELRITSTNNPNDYIVLYKAVPVANLRAVFAPDGERIWPVQFVGFIPESTHAHAGKLLALHYSS